MAAPLMHLLLDSRAEDTREARRLREIENHYHLERVATDVQAVTEFHVQAANQQAEQVEKTLETFGSVEQGIAELSAILGCGLEGLQNQIALQTEAIESGLAQVTEELVRQNLALDRVVQALRRPYESQSLELRTQADKWADIGRRTTAGPIQSENYVDAMNLYKEVVKNPIGKQDYVAWFEIGWLHWKIEGKYLDAEAAFGRAARLAVERTDPYYLRAVRHQAYMQCRQERWEAAYDTLKDSLPFDKTHSTLFDLARYACKTDRIDEAVQLLDLCIDRNPVVMQVMFAEEDFLVMLPNLRDLALRKQRQVEHAWQKSLAEAERIVAEFNALPPVEPRTLSIVREASDTLASAKRFAGLRSYVALRRAVDLARKVIGAEKDAASSLQDYVHDCIERANSYAEAIQYYVAQYARTETADALKILSRDATSATSYVDSAHILKKVAAHGKKLQELLQRAAQSVDRRAVIRRVIGTLVFVPLCFAGGVLLGFVLLMVLYAVTFGWFGHPKAMDGHYRGPVAMGVAGLITALIGVRAVFANAARYRTHNRPSRKLLEGVSWPTTVAPKPSVRTAGDTSAASIALYTHQREKVVAAARNKGTDAAVRLYIEFTGANEEESRRAVEQLLGN